MKLKTIENRILPAEPGMNRRTAIWAAIGPVLFAITYTILGFIRPGYSLVSEPISGLGAGTHALVMNASFILMAGVMVSIGVFGIIRSMTELSPASRRVCLILLQLSPVGAILCGLFNYEHFLWHTSGFFLGCGVQVIVYPIIGILLRRIPRYRRLASWLIAGGPATLLLFVWYMATFDYLNTDTGTAGLIERILVLEVHAFYFALGWLAYRGKL